ncbi:CoA transferase [Novosphingobium sp. MBES04]|uniref:CoA transferase n=1 Tax=Novosphingobium sp. MBES04 TaxID=1206458 RepID=UPI0006940C2D|nr:CoA transferase [Novosphingobium sp. MBES04]GAM04312.1 acyl-CoA transferase/carnitine dehydratase-like protein [Novosphingobium sp. MBES04]
MIAPAIPLTRWAQGQLDALAALSPAAHLPEAGALLAERAVLHGLTVPGAVSCRGGCRFHRTRDGWVALNLARPSDRELLPALFQTDAPIDLATGFALLDEAEAVARGRLLGMAIAGLSERPASPALAPSALGHDRPAQNRPPRVLDLSALWAGPLAARLLRLCGGEVTRIESRGREDRLRETDPRHFTRLAEGKRTVALDLRTAAGRDLLTQLIAQADIVIEAARPRALRQLGFDAEALVRARPGLVWLTITGHGIAGEATNWVGFGDDTSVAGGLSARLHAQTGQVGFVGDAIADPLTGIFAARAALERYRTGHGGRLIVAMSGLVGEAVAQDPHLSQDLVAWNARRGQPILAPEAVPC